MLNLKKITGLAAAALMASVVSASAVPLITNNGSSVNNATTGLSPAGFGANLPTGATGWSTDPTYTPPPGSTPSVTLSPFGDNVSPYFLVTTGTTPPGAPTPVKLSFSSAQTSFDILWGSVDPTNRLDFRLGGSLVATVTGTSLLADGKITSTGGNQVNLLNFLFSGGETFDNIDFSTGQVAFEYALVPLPAAAWLLLAGLGGMGLVARRRKAAA